MHNVLFTPFVSVKVEDDGTVVGVEIDWSDTLQNDYRDEVEVWSSSSTNDLPPTTTAASSYLDAEATRERILAAFQPTASAVILNVAELGLLGEALDSYEYWEHREVLPHDSGFITVMDDQGMDEVFADSDEDEVEAASEAWAAVKAARALATKLNTVAQTALDVETEEPKLNQHLLAKLEILQAALRHLAEPNRGARPSGGDAINMADYAKAELDRAEGIS